MKSVTRTRRAEGLMKPRVMWAIVDRRLNTLGYESQPYSSARPLLFDREKWARFACGSQGRVAKVEIREVRRP